MAREPREAVRRWAGRVPRRWLRGGPAVVAGRALLVVTGLLVALTVPLLRPTPADWLVLLGLAALHVALLLLSLVLPWARMGARGPALFLVAQVLGLTAAGAATERIAGSYVPLFTLGFAYAGYFLPPRTAYVVLPVALPLRLLASGGLDVPVVVRTLVAAAVWVLVAEGLAAATHRQRAASAVLERDARTDPLTTIGNRRDLEARMTLLVPGDSVVVCDLDHFKQLNDTHGHAFGDQVLRDFSALLRAGLRRDDHAVRFGGEEFVLLLPGSGNAVAVDVVERLRTTWRELGGATTFSAGCATLDEVTDAQRALVAADAALYAAKRAGRDRTRSAEAGGGWEPGADGAAPAVPADPASQE